MFIEKSLELPMRIFELFGFSAHKSKHSAHLVYAKTVSYNEKGKAHHLVFKKNKHAGVSGQIASTTEAAFTSLANLLGRPSHSLPQHLVYNSKNQVTGLAGKHAAEVLINFNKDHIKFYGMEALPKKEYISTAEFNEWITGFKEIKLLDKSDNHFNDPAKYTQKDFEELKTLEIALNELDEKDYFALSDYCIDLIKKGKTLPDETWRNYSKEQLSIIYRHQELLLKSKEHVVENTVLAQQTEQLGEGKGYQFLEHLPQNFFAQLMEAKKAQQVDVDMDSLADVLTTAYGLEDDDLHKGNIGCYVTINEDKRPHFHFFKIDNDLMFVSKLMATRKGERWQAHSLSSNKNFQITARDLQGFPDLIDSGNHYWPTRKRIMVTDSKAYKSEEDREAYRSLKEDKQFNQAKWTRFFKQAVMPHELVIKSLEQPLREKDVAEQKGSISLIQRALSVRTNELRATLLTIPEFRTFINEHLLEARALILAELEEHAKALDCTPEEINQHIIECQENLDTMVLSNLLATPTTPVHAAILSKSYRCNETFGRFLGKINTKDSYGLTPMDHAIELYNFYQNIDKNPEKSTYYADIICELDSKSANYTNFSTNEYKEATESAKINNSVSQLPQVNSLDAYKKALEAIRAKPWSSLKQDKVLALALLEKAQLNANELKELSDELNSKELDYPIKFIKELRSELWLVKMYRGAYGKTTTLDQMNHCIKQKSQALEEQADLESSDERSSSARFF